MNSNPPSMYNGFNLEIGDRVLFFLKIAIVALVFIVFGVGATALLATAACAAMGYEWFRLTTNEQDFDEPIVGAALAAAALPPFIAFLVGPAGGIIIALLAGAFLLQMGPKDEDRLHYTAPGLFLIGLAGVCFVWLRADAQHGLAVTAWLVFVVAATEAGSAFMSNYNAKKEDSSDPDTRTALTELSVSLVCGVVAGVVVAAFYRDGNIFWVIVASLMIAATVVLAGLVVDYLKRVTGMRASGSLFLGRGAVIENFDGLVFASIFAGLLTVAGGALFSW